MQEIKTLIRGKWTFRHVRYEDPMGFWHDSGELIETKPNGFSEIRPFLLPMKVRTVDRSTAIGPRTDLNDYTDEEYEKIFDDELAVIESYQT